MEEVDLDNRSITHGNEHFGFDKLAFATGTRVRRLPISGGDLPGIHYLRSVDDADGIRRDLAGASSLIAIGGGFIGLEIAAVARKKGIAVTVIEAQNRLMERAVSPVISEYFANFHRAQGVSILLAASVSAIVKNDRWF